MYWVVVFSGANNPVFGRRCFSARPMTRDDRTIWRRSRRCRLARCQSGQLAWKSVIQLRHTMEKRFLPGLFLLTAVLAISVPVAAQVQDAWIGTWKLNLAKSKYDPANLAPKSQTVKLEAVAGGGMKGTVDGVDAQGKPSHQEYTTMFDGKSSEIKGA